MSWEGRGKEEVKISNKERKESRNKPHLKKKNNNEYEN